MGVPGLWDVLRPAGQVRSLTHLSVVDGFEKNSNSHRGFRLGIDASIWFYHATYGREGENPELRTLFFRCTRLMGMPFLPLFVFDGEERPSEKRGKRISGKDHWMVQGMQSIIKAFGFEWHMAPGEAEAELAYLNRVGVIDGILSDDVDNFLFGAKLVIRNPSANLTGNRAHVLKNSAGKIDDQHVAIYDADALRTREDIQLTRGGLILIGVLRGGDYHQAGLTGCGVTIAHGLAKGGFGDSLYNAARTMDRKRLERFLDEWREQVREELRTNSKGLIGRKNPSLAKSIPGDFPDVDIVLSYTKPITSETKGGLDASRFNWEKEPDLGKIAGVCELYFEWGVKDIIIKRFRTVIWPSAVLRILRRSVLLTDGKARASITPGHGKDARPFVGTPSKMITKHFSSLALASPANAASESDDEDEDNLIVKIHSSRRHASTDCLLEYRLEISPSHLIRLTESGIRGLRTEILKSSRDADEEELEGDEEEGKTPSDPHAHLRVWVPACMVEIAEPGLVEDFEAKELAKQQKKRAAKASAKKGKAATANVDVPSPPRARRKAKAKQAPLVTTDDDADPEVLPQLTSSRDEYTIEDPVISKPAKVTAHVGSSRRNGGSVDAFFKASKAATTAKAQTKASTVASLFEDMSHIRHDYERVASAAPTSSQQSHRSSAAPSGSQLCKPAAPQRTPSILSFFDAMDVSPQKDYATTSRKAVDDAPAPPRPFPMIFSDDEQNVPAVSARNPHSPKHKRRSSNSNSWSESDDENKIPKSPRKSHSRDSPRRSQGNHTPHRDTRQRDRSVSPSPMRYPPAAVPRPRPAVKPAPKADQSIIVISSDSEDDTFYLPKRIPLTTPATTSRNVAKPRKQISQSDVIDLT